MTDKRKTTGGELVEDFTRAKRLLMTGEPLPVEGFTRGERVRVFNMSPAPLHVRTDGEDASADGPGVPVFDERAVTMQACRLSLLGTKEAACIVMPLRPL